MSDTTTKINLTDSGQRYAWAGNAVRFAGYPQVWTNECIEGEEGEWTDDTDSGMVYVIMIGDDHKHLVDLDDLTVIDDDEYCACCGQIGCGWL